jgi:hypothetical protein
LYFRPLWQNILFKTVKEKLPYGIFCGMKCDEIYSFLIKATTLVPNGQLIVLMGSHSS